MEHIAQSGSGGGGERDDEGITKKPRIHHETSFVKRLDRGVGFWHEVLMVVWGGVEERSKSERTST